MILNAAQNMELVSVSLDLDILTKNDKPLNFCYIYTARKGSSLTFWGCNGFDGMSRIAGCMPSLRDELVQNHPAIKCS